MYEKILVPLDGSSEAEIVLPYVEGIAAKFGAEVILVSVLEPAEDERDQLYRYYLERIVKQVQRQLKNWGAKDGIVVKCEILTGKPAGEIMRYADESNVNLITMTSYGRSGRSPWFMGNVAAKVLRTTGKPVLLIRAPADKATLKRKSLIKRILVPLDGSAVGETAIPYAETLGQMLGSELVLFQVVKPPVPIGIEAPTMSTIYEEELERTRASAVVYLDRVEKKLQEKGLSTSSAINLGPPADQIIDFAETNAVDLIAMSTHGRSGIGRWVFGSVTDKVVHAGNIAVMTIRATES
jgi:nucleotide-binding universal stress UspA family protein